MGDVKESMRASGCVTPLSRLKSARLEFDAVILISLLFRFVRAELL